MAQPALTVIISEIIGCFAETLDVAYYLTIYVSARDALAYVICSACQLGKYNINNFNIFRITKVFIYIYTVCNCLPRCRSWRNLGRNSLIKICCRVQIVQCIY